MTALAAEIARLIVQEGPLSVSRYMALCLGHPVHGYYRNRDPFGSRGDFTTAPEISQIFGELIGLWAGATWQMMGEPAALRLVELGPGRGTLMRDALRAAAIVPGFRAALSVHLVETSPVLRERQAQMLAASGVEPVWHDDLEPVLEGPVIVLANEFLDALPLDQYVMTGEGWRERLIGLDERGGLRFGLSGAVASDIRVAAPPGTILEQPLAALELTRRVAGHVAERGGAALFIDYGSLHTGFGDTLQAVRAHRFVDPLIDPGEADLTVQVDFARMALAARRAGAAVHGGTTQAAFLAALGLEARLATLLRKATPAQAETLRAGVSRLTEMGSTGMGELFKVMAFADPGLPPLPGFDHHRQPEHG